MYKSSVSSSIIHHYDRALLANSPLKIRVRQSQEIQSSSMKPLSTQTNEYLNDPNSNSLVSKGDAVSAPDTRMYNVEIGAWYCLFYT